MIAVAVYDEALAAFMRPFFMQTIAQAVRSFHDEVKRPDGNDPMHKHPEDYKLYCLGEWDEETGEFKNQKQLIASGRDVNP